MDSNIRPYSNNSWIIEQKNTSRRLGYLGHSGGAFTIVAEVGTPLEGVRTGPWLSKEDAMATMATSSGELACSASKSSGQLETSRGDFPNAIAGRLQVSGALPVYPDVIAAAVVAAAPASRTKEGKVRA